jgi:hypothetical protein
VIVNILFIKVLWEIELFVAIRRLLPIEPAVDRRKHFAWANW